MSRFVTAGGGEPQTTEDAAREDAWAKAQAQIEALRAKPNPTEGKQEGGKTLYETLQANKAAKQAEFEEQAKLKNQFRALDDDELDFLDSVQQSTRAKEDAVRKETAAEVDAFRRQQQDAEQKAKDATAATESSTIETSSADVWKTKKRRRKELDMAASKIRKTTTESTSPPPPPQPHMSPEPTKDTAKVSQKESGSPSAQNKTDLGLGAYSDSDED